MHNELICPKCKESPHGICGACYIERMTEIARANVWQHLWMSLICLFSFKFIECIVEFAWAIERIFEIGDYGKDGQFARLGIDWRKPLDY